jgi:hypothetical protein
LLIDFPWQFEDLRYNADAHQFLGDFVNLLRMHGAEAVRILPDNAVNEIYQQLTRTKGNTPLRLLFQLLPKLAGHANEGTEATPDCEAIVSTEWKRALRQEIEASDWRNPQIITSTLRRSSWGEGHEVEVRLDDGARTARLVVAARTHEVNPFAVSDFDPWILERQLETETDPEKRFRLPKPTVCNSASLATFRMVIADECGSWREVDVLGLARYVFIPPADWFPNAAKAQWRAGNVFRKETCKESERQGYIDRDERLWVWDAVEKHWDVQMDRRCRKDDYYRITATGRRLG